MADWLLCHLWIFESHRTWDSHLRCRSSPWKAVLHKSLCPSFPFHCCNERRVHSLGPLQNSTHRNERNSFSVVSLTFQPIVRLLGNLEKKHKGRAMVVRPVVFACSATKVLLLIVGCSLWSVDYVVFVPMAFLQEVRYLQQNQACLDIQSLNLQSEAPVWGVFLLCQLGFYSLIRSHWQGNSWQ